MVVDSADVASQSLTKNVVGKLERDLCSQKFDLDLQDMSKLRSLFLENEPVRLFLRCLHWRGCSLSQVQTKIAAFCWQVDFKKNHVTLYCIIIETLFPLHEPKIITL